MCENRLRHAISEVLEQLNQEGAELDEQAVGALSPYLRQHINRLESTNST